MSMPIAGVWGTKKLFAAFAMAIGVGAAGLCLSPVAHARVEPPATNTTDDAPLPATSGSRYIRVQEDAAGNAVIMQAAVRTFARSDGKGPKITMCSAVHIGDKSFYTSLQQLLDAKDVVLFEGVKPPGMGRAEHDLPGVDDLKRKRTATELRIRMLAMSALSQSQRGKLPSTIQELIDNSDAALKPFVREATKDAWGNPIVYALAEPAATEPAPAAPDAPDSKPDAQPNANPDAAASPDAPKPAQPAKPAARFSITSFGSDAKPGGEDDAKDLTYADQKPLKIKDLPKGGAKGIQGELASALGLVFQLDAMTHDHANWRNSDLSVDQLTERLGRAGADSEELFKMLSGSGAQASIMTFVLRIIKMMPSVQLMGKVMMMEALTRADDLLNVMPGFDKSFNVIINERNQIVEDDVKAIIESEPNVKTLGIIYGGGHMPDLETRLAALGYQESDVTWLDAIRVDLPKTKADRDQIQSMRASLRDMLEKQIKQARKQAAAKDKQPKDTE